MCNLYSMTRPRDAVLKFFDIGSNRFWPIERCSGRSFTKAADDHLTPSPWQVARLRPIKLISPSEPVEVAAPIPDYPPLFFRHRCKHHRLPRADGPERIEREWWVESGEPRDYFQVEGEEGARYWLFRLGHYKQGKAAKWSLHGILRDPNEE
jgi:protein ImuB